MNAKQMLAKLDGYGGIISFNSEELDVTLRALRLLAAAEANDGERSQLIEELRTEADLCRNETATDIADLLDDAASALIATGALFSALKDERNALAARVAELEPDAERLDWCQANHFAPRATLITTSGDTSPKVWINDQPRLGYMGRSLREAIDAARSK